MVRKTAAELKVGDVFYRETYRQPDPAVDWKYTVHGLQRIPLRDFYGKPLDVIRVTAVNHVTGPATFNLGLDEGVWITDDPPTPAPISGGAERATRRRWGRRG
jgi:hypothetical protein